MLIPKAGEVWEHHSSRLYLIVLLANDGCDKAKFPLTVVYRQLGTDKVYARPWEAFKQRFKKHVD
jgi:hypothetical protein